MKIVGIVVALILLACSSTPSSKYYLLDADAVQAEGNTKLKNVRIDHIYLPDYLKQDKLVMKLDSHEIVFANYHMWGERFDKAITRSLTNRLNEGSDRYFYTKNCNKCKNLKVYVEHFYPNEKGEVHLAGSYEYAGKVKVFNLEKKLDKNGYEASITSMASLIKDLSMDINEGLNNM